MPGLSIFIGRSPPRYCWALPLTPLAWPSTLSSTCYLAELARWILADLLVTQAMNRLCILRVLTFLTTLGLNPNKFLWLTVPSYTQCLHVVELIDTLGLDLGQLVWAINFGNYASCSCSQMQAACKSFMRGQYFIPTLHNICHPPRLKSKGKCPPGAKEVLDQFSLAITCLSFWQELRSYAKLPGVNIREFAETDKLKAMSYEHMESDVKKHCPTLFKALHMLSTSVHWHGKWCINLEDSEFVSTVWT